MRRGARHGMVSEEDDFNPVTDLVFTLFAVSILLLGVVGSSGAIREEALRTRLRESEAAKAGSVREPDAARSDTVAALEEDLGNAMRELAALRAAAAGRIEIAALGPDKPAGFLFDTALDEDVSEEILLALGQNLDRIEEMEANRITFEVDVAPAIRAGGDPAGNVEYEASVGIVRALMRRLLATPIPFTCVSAVPFGKNRAATLGPLDRSDRPGDLLSTFGSLGAGPADLSKSRAALESLAGADNRIVILAERVASAPCEPGRLVEGIRRWIAER